MAPSGFWNGWSPVVRSIMRSEEHTSELQSRLHLVCRLLLDKKQTNAPSSTIPGLAPGVSSTPPLPTPPARWTTAPVWAPAPAVAPEPTIAFAPTQAPILTYL